MRKINAFDAGVIALGAALNVSVGYLVSLLKLPLYLDSIGTVMISVLCGWFYGLITGLASLLVLAVTASPTVVAYAGTVTVIALVSALLGKFGFLRRKRMTIIGGLILGFTAAAASVPVTTLIYGGVSLAGADAITAFMRAYGLSIWKSVVIGGLITESIDKVMTSLIAMALLSTLPSRILARLGGNRAGSHSSDG